jgi:acetyltransferase-like isoleucine patch superfamily enzyme
MASQALIRLYRFRRLQGLVMRVARRVEGGDLRSTTIREIFRRYHGVEVGLYTHGSGFSLFMIDPQTVIGRYCSIAAGVRILNHNHPLDFKGTSPLFFNPDLGCCDEWLVSFNPTEIGNDVWIGANAVILPEVSRIGDGAVIGAGAIVNRDVPPYAVVLEPGRVVKYRFPEKVVAELSRRSGGKDPADLPGGMKGFQVRSRAPR